MSDGTRPTSTDLMGVLTQVQADVAKLVKSRDEHALAIGDHGRRLGALEELRREDRELVTRLHDRIAEVSGKVTAVLDLSERSEKITREVLSLAVKDFAGQMTVMVRGEMASVRGDMQGLRDEVKGLRDEVHGRPCLVGECSMHPPAPPAEGGV